MHIYNYNSIYTIFYKVLNNKYDIIIFQAKWSICFHWKAWYGIDGQCYDKTISDNFIQEQARICICCHSDT